MTTKFPTELDTQATRMLISPFLNGQGFKLDGQFAWAAWDTVGFALYQVFGDVQPMLAQENPDHVSNVLATAPPEVQQFMSFVNRDGNQVMGAQDLPPWLIPFVQAAAQWAIQKLLERLNKQENPTLFGFPIKSENRQLPRPSGGAFPERSLGVPTGTGIHTQTQPALTESQQAGAQSQPSDQIQQPTGKVPEQHPSVPQSSKSPQFQGNTAQAPAVKSGTEGHPQVQQPNPQNPVQTPVPSTQEPKRL
jgi:hypothetical protein